MCPGVPNEGCRRRALRKTPKNFPSSKKKAADPPWPPTIACRPRADRGVTSELFWVGAEVPSTPCSLAFGGCPGPRVIEDKLNMSRHDANMFQAVPTISRAGVNMPQLRSKTGVCGSFLCCRHDKKRGKTWFLYVFVTLRCYHRTLC